MARVDTVQLREVEERDLPVFFRHQQDPEANHMAAFTAKDPNDRQAFLAHWSRIMNQETITIRSILYEGQVAGYILVHNDFGEPEVSYWIGKEFWGKGIATNALADFLSQISTRPLYGHVAKDNLGSYRVLEKCGFKLVGEDKGFANARGKVTEEYVLELK